MPRQTGFKSRMLVALMLVFALWATTAIAGVNEDFINAAKSGDLSAVKSFIAGGADVNAKVNNGLTALMLASQQGNKEVVELLLAKGADVNAKNNEGWTALVAASSKGHKEIVGLLLAKGANVDAKMNYGGTALIAASLMGHKEVMQVLIDKGADVNAKDNDGWTALINASVQGNKEVVKLLLANGADVNAQSKPAKNGTMFVGREGQGWTTMEQDTGGETALTFASRKGYKEIVELLIRAGANRALPIRSKGSGVQQETSEKSGKTGSACADKCKIQYNKGEFKAGITIEDCIKATCK
jgi:ankyrin repeat protein